MRTAVVAGLSFLLFSGCSDDDELDCGSVEYGTCDIRSEQCQRLVFDQMRCLRGSTDAPRPRVSVVSVEDLRQELESQGGEMESDDELEQVYASLAVLGLLDLDDTTVDAQVEFQLDALLGFYSHASKRIVVVDHGAPLDDEQATTTLGHEYIHAMQDAEFDLRRYQNDVTFSYDSGLAATSLIEGEAVLFDGFQLARIIDRDPAFVDWLGYYGEFTAAANEYSAEERSPVLVAPAIFPYTYGGYGAAVSHERAGTRGIDQARRRDLSTQSFLARRAESSVFVPQDAAALVELEVSRVGGLEPLGAESLGAWLVHAFLVRVLSDPVEPDLARYWRGDVISLFHDEATGASEFVWKVRFTAPARASSFSQRVDAAVARNNGSWSASSSGDVSVIVGSSRPGADLSRLLDAATSEPASSRRDPGSLRVPSEQSGAQHPIGRALSRLAPGCLDNALVRAGL